MSNQHRQFIRYRLLGVLFVCSLTFCLWLNYVPFITWQEKTGGVVIAQTPDASQLVQQGVQSYQIGNFESAIKYWQEALNIYNTTNKQANATIVLENLARTYQQMGQMDKSIADWDKVIAYYRQTRDMQQMGRMLTEQAQVYSSLGQPKKAIALLCGVLTKESQQQAVQETGCLQESALQISRNQKDYQGEAAALGSLGEAYRLMGDYEQAIKYLENAENIATNDYKFLVLNSLGNTYVSQAQLWTLRANSARSSGVPRFDQFQQYAKSDYKKALEEFQSSLKQARTQGDVLAQASALSNLIQLYYRTDADQTQLKPAVEEALILLDKLPDSNQKVYIAIDLANLPAIGADDAATTYTISTNSRLTQCPIKRQIPDKEVVVLLNNAIKTAKNLKSSRSESFAAGALGHFYECRQEYEQALKLTQEALWQADQSLLAKDSLYLWNWQAGRIFKLQGKNSEAVAAYQEAYSTLKDIRSDILNADRNLQFDFRDVVAPLYREFAQLELELAPLSSNKTEKQLTNALETIESLKLAELQNYFGNDCILTALTNSQKIDELLGENTAVISSIILEEKTAIILSLPNGKKRFKWIDKERKILSEEVKQFRQGLKDELAGVIDYDQTQAQKLYNWIIRPFEADLNQNKINTIVFTQDGFLRSIPMAALHDGKKYLIEKYAIATTPSLRLTAAKKQNIQRNRALILGLTTKAKVDDKDYPALLKVDSEIKAIEEQFPNSKLLKDTNFNRDQLEQELDRVTYPIIHIATHAQFGTLAEDTFLVTGENNKLTINELESILRQVNNGSNLVELLTLTACQTAVGDDRATLGLAGVALQAGVKSALASLWSVRDDSTSILVSEFYRNLRNPGMSKVEALRQAQIKLIRAKQSDINDQFEHPVHWAPFILIGNWL
ncbi:CHAT domain-containing protein [Nostoc sp. UHCC 0702]|nr:CHAT domain-containing protein [Nostoc sp. UHCC 0702]